MDRVGDVDWADDAARAEAEEGVSMDGAYNVAGADKTGTADLKPQMA